MVVTAKVIDFPGLDFDEKREAIKMWVDQLVLTEVNLFIYYRFPLNL